MTKKWKKQVQDDDGSALFVETALYVGKLGEDVFLSFEDAAKEVYK